MHRLKINWKWSAVSFLILCRSVSGHCGDRGPCQGWARPTVPARSRQPRGGVGGGHGHALGSPSPGHRAPPRGHGWAKAGLEHGPTDGSGLVEPEAGLWGQGLAEVTPRCLHRTLGPLPRAPEGQDPLSNASSELASVLNGELLSGPRWMVLLWPFQGALPLYGGLLLMVQAGCPPSLLWAGVMWGPLLLFLLHSSTYGGSGLPRPGQSLPVHGSCSMWRSLVPQEAQQNKDSEVCGCYLSPGTPMCVKTHILKSRSFLGNYISASFDSKHTFILLITRIQAKPRHSQNHKRNLSSLFLTTECHSVLLFSS